MPVYQYQGKHYTLADGLSPEQAKAKIQSHVAGEQSINVIGGALDVGGGLLESATTGAVDMFGGLAAQGLAVGDALLRGKDVSKARDEMSEAYSESTAHKILSPKTKTGEWIEEKMGEGVEWFKDKTMSPEFWKQASTMKGLPVGIPGMLGMLPKEALGVPAAIASALPEVSAVPLAAGATRRGKAKAVAPKPATKADALIEEVKRTAELADRPTGDVMGQMANDLAGEKKVPFEPSGPGTPGMGGAEVFGRMSEDLQKQAILDSQYGPLFAQLEQQRLKQEAEALRSRQADKQGSAAFDEMAFQVQPKETPVNLPPQAQALAWMAKQIEDRTGRKATEAELAALWKEQAMAKDRQAAAQAAVDSRNQALEQGVARNVDLNEHGPNRTTLGPDGLRETAQERMEFVQDANRGANVVDQSVNGVSGLTREVPGARAAQVGPEASPVTIITNQLREQAGMGLKNDPRVQKALERVENAEVLYLKAAQLAKEGRVTRAQMARLQRDLEGLRASTERTIGNVTGKRATKGPKGQRGAVNPEVFKEGFEKLKQLGDGTWLRAYGDGQILRIEAIKDSHKIGEVQFNPKYGSEKNAQGKWERHVESDWTHVANEHREKGMGRAMYEFASELGNDVKKSWPLSENAQLMWNSMEKRGMAENGIIKSKGNKQTGAINLPAIKEGVEKLKKGLITPHEYLESFKGTFESLDHHIQYDLADPKSRKTIVLMSPEDYHKLAESRGVKGAKAVEVRPERYKDIQESLNSEKGWWEMPALYTDYNETTKTLDVSGHEGRHRTDVFEHMGVEKIPVLVLDSKLRWGETTEQPVRFRNQDSWGKEHWTNQGHPQYVPYEGNLTFKYDENGNRIKSPGNKQTGAIFLNPKQHNKLKDVGAIEKILGPIAPSKWTPDDAIAIAEKAPDVNQNFIQKGINYFTKGGLYQALKTKNPVVRYGVEQVLENDRIARANIQEFVHDKLAPAFRDLSKSEQIDVWKVINHADYTQTPITREQMLKHGFSEKEIYAVETHRQVMDRSFEAMNKVRAQLGMDPVKKREAYAAMNASGDYRMVVKKDGEIVGIVGRNDKWSSDVLAERLRKEGYEIGERHYIGAIARERGSAQTALLQALDFLAKDDVRLKELLLKADEVMRDEAYGFLNMKVHTKQKKGVFGMQGRKNDLMPYDNVFQLDQSKQARLDDLNAREGLQGQVAYAEMALKWEPMTDAAVNIKKVLTSEALKDKQHFAKKWTEEYLQNALGYNPDAVGQGLERALSHAFDKTGVGYSKGRTAMSNARKVVNTMLLGLSPGFWASNVMQPMASMPAMKASLVAKGLDAGFDFGTGYNYVAQGGMSYMRQKSGKMTAFDADALAYAKKYHVFGSDLIEHSNRVRKDAVYRAEQAGNFVAGAVESSTRQTVFNTFAYMLKDNGMSAKNGLFEAAHNLTDMAMNNYSSVERPRMYNTMGPFGQLSANLASFKHNEVSRIAMFARQIGEDKSAKPLLISLATMTAFAGLKGVILWEEADWLYKQITSMMGKPDSLTLRVIKLSEELGGAVNKFTGATEGKVGDASHVASHGAFSLLGMDMSNRLGLGDAISDTPADFLFPGGSKLGQMAGTAYDAIRHPSEMNTKRAVREWSPAAITGAQDLTWFSKGDTAVNRKTLEAQYQRSYQDKVVKATGLTSINESVFKQKKYEVDWIKQAYADKRKPVIERAHAELFTKGGISESTVRDYLKYEGDVANLQREIDRTLKKQSIPEKDRDLLKSAMSRSITSLQHAKRLNEAYK